MSDFDFEPLEPLPVRSEQKQQKEIWQPRWRCFCCQDTGKIQPNLVRLVIPDYNYDRDRLPICQNCNLGHNWFHLDQFRVIDQRISSQICKKLDAIAREDWRQTQERQFINIKALAKKLAMPGSGDRTDNDNREVQLQKAEIEAITHEQWMAMSNAYSRGDVEQQSN